MVYVSVNPDTGFVTILLKDGDKIHMRTKGDTIGNLILVIREELGEESEQPDRRTDIKVTDKGN